MSNVTGCQVGYKTKFNKCKDCPYAPYRSEKCIEFTHNKIADNWYCPKPWLTLITDVPINPIVWANIINPDGDFK